ncbi:hypothetical protein [Microbacterium sp. A1-JK]|uniref:hypothetical protein n=1 Tax=Microbacterium sp. A1-JK TaxID=3177516 RepID=UPI00388692A6
MSLDIFEREVDRVRADVATAHRAHANTTADIDADANLSPEGKTAAKKKAEETYLPKLAELREQEKKLIKDAISRRRAEIESPAGATPDSIIAFRDAQDRAERIKDADEANRVLERSLRQNDTSLAHAIFRVGVERRYQNVISTFTAEKPEVRTAVDEIATLERFRDDFLERTLAYAPAR